MTASDKRETGGAEMSWFDDIQARLKGEEKEPPKGSLMATRAGSIVGSLPFPLLLCDKQMTMIGGNQAFKHLFRLHNNELEGKSLFSILGNATRSLHQPKFLEKGNPKILEGTFPKIGRRVFHVFMRTLPRKGKVERLLLFQDVTTEKDLEQKIIHSRREFLAILDGIDDPIVMIDKDFKIRRVNNTMVKTLGAGSYKDFIGETCYRKLHGFQEVCPGCTAGKTFATGQRTTRTGLLETKPHAEEFVYRINHYPLKDPSGEVTGIVEIYHDLIETLRVKEELCESERSRITEALAAGVAHEVRNPLAVIQSNAQYCLSAVDENTDLKESLTAILRSSEEANRVIKGLLDYARPQAIHFERQSLKPILEEGLSLIQGRAKNQHVQLKTSISKRLRRLVVDQKRLLQAIMNYLINALDAMPHGGTLKVSAQAHHNGKMVEIMIGDTGKGVPAEMIPKLFQPFYTTRKGGVGLGFSIAEGIIRSHGGKVSFKSWEGQGSMVRLLLPYQRGLKDPLFPSLSLSDAP